MTQRTYDVTHLKGQQVASLCIEFKGELKSYPERPFKVFFIPSSVVVPDDVVAAIKRFREENAQ